jgi:hypothetical protein
VHRANGLEDVFTRRAFEQVTFCSSRYRADDAFVGIVSRQDDDARSGILAADLLQRRNAVKFGRQNDRLR